MASGFDPDKDENKNPNLKPSNSKENLTFEVSNKMKKDSAMASLSLSRSLWDPLKSPDWDRAGSPGPLAATRIKRDIKQIFMDPLPGIFIAPDEENICVVRALIMGPFDTPYEGGFFNFAIRFGPQYPLHPPRVRFLTTSSGTVRFNPNLYASGMVCLSIIGTWNGPGWSAASTLSSLLLSIQSLLNEHPIYNEPGYAPQMKNATKEQLEHGMSGSYNKYLVRQTLSVAVVEHMINLDKLESKDDNYVKFCQNSFLEFYDFYIKKCEELTSEDGVEGERKVRKESDVPKYFMQGTPVNLNKIAKTLSKIKEKILKSELELNLKEDRGVSPDSVLSDASSFEEDIDPSEEAKSIMSEANFLYDEIESEEEQDENSKLKENEISKVEKK